MGKVVLTNQGKPEHFFIHLGKVVACFGVISIHAFTWNTVTLASGPIIDWWAQQIVLSFTVWVVPLFIMMSGATLLPVADESAVMFWQKRWKRIGVPTLIWLGLYSVFFAWQRGDVLTLQNVLLKPLIGPFEHLYFLVILLGLAVFTPGLRQIVHKISRDQLLFLCGVFFFIAFFWQRSRFSGTMFVPYLGYYLWGAWLLNWNKKFAWRTLLSLGGMLCTGILLATVWSTHWNEGWYVQDPFWYRHWNPAVAILTTTVWLLLRKASQTCWLQSEITRQRIKILSRHTFGMYLVFLMTQASMLSLALAIWPDIDLRWYHCVLFIPTSAFLAYLPVYFWEKMSKSIAEFWGK